MACITATDMARRLEHAMTLQNESSMELFEKVNELLNNEMLNNPSTAFNTNVRILGVFLSVYLSRVDKDYQKKVVDHILDIANRKETKEYIESSMVQ